MGRRNRKNKRRINSLLLLLLLTASMLVVSTYAWFSTNREVSITGISAQVSAAAGLQISLDGEIWGSSVNVTADGLNTLNANGVKNVYQWPTKLSPVSTDGSISGSDVAFYYGRLTTDGNGLTGVAAESARTANDSGSSTSSSAKFIAFDIYLKNSSGLSAGDHLQLNVGSLVAADLENGGAADTGLEYSARVGFLLYDDTEPLSAGGATVRTLAIGNNPVVSIWEPNYNQHIQYVVDNDARVTGLTHDFRTLGLTANAVTGATETLTGINASTVPQGENPAFAIPLTVKTSGTVGSATGEAATDLTSVTSASTSLVLGQNTIMRARVYIWLEGQDPDCNDTASTGKQIKFVINLSKPAE